ncbi:MAG: hypothetical protein K2O24_08170 [Muribaculaceae bacterium]|nr:hypothetical protein [Muribaculaceae bacterium]
MKKFLTVLAVTLLLPSGMAAAAYQWLIFSFSDGSQLSVAAENLEIHYNQENLILTSNQVNETVPTATLASMRFSDTCSGIDGLPAESLSGPVTLYTLGGVEAGKFRNLDEARTSLPAGTYVIKSGAKSVKVIFSHS